MTRSGRERATAELTAAVHRAQMAGVSDEEINAALWTKMMVRTFHAGGWDGVTRELLLNWEVVAQSRPRPSAANAVGGFSWGKLRAGLPTSLYGPLQRQRHENLLLRTI